MTPAWQNQTKDNPLFPDILWSRPERKSSAGKLLVIGGSTHGFATVAQAIQAAKDNGVGEVRSVLPKSLERYLGAAPELLYVPQTHTGSLSKDAFGDIRGYLQWATAVLIPGDLTQNAETTILLEQILNFTSTSVVLSNEAIDLTAAFLRKLDNTENIVPIANFKQMQNLIKNSGVELALTSSATLEQQITTIQKFINQRGLPCASLHSPDHVLVVSGNTANLTKIDTDITTLAAKTAVLAAQFTTKPFEATTTASMI